MVKRMKMKIFENEINLFITKLIHTVNTIVLSLMYTRTCIVSIHVVFSART